MYNKSIRRTIFEDRDARKYKYNRISYARFCKGMVNRLKNHKDATIVITGVTGQGKSTLAGKFCFKEFEKIDNFITGEGKMYEDKNFCTDPEEFAKKMVTERGSVIWLDEAIDAVNNRNWNSKINNLITSRKNKNRKRFNIYFLLLPFESQIDKAISYHINFWIWVKKRKVTKEHPNGIGVAQIFGVNHGRKGGMGLDIKGIIERENKWRKENFNKNDVPPTIHPEFMGYFAFHALSKEHQKRYDRLVEEHKAYGKLTEEEMKSDGVEVSKVEDFIPLEIDKIEKGEIKKKIDLWKALKEKTGFADDLLERKINRHLKMRSLVTFNRLKLEDD